MDHSESSFYAGASKVDITPPPGTFINGDFVSHFARYVHDHLYAKAIVMRKNEKRVAIVVVDICVMPKDFLDEVCDAIAGQLGIEPAHIIISSTHTHAAGSVSSIYLGPVDYSYRKKLLPLFVQAVKLAENNLRPAFVGFGTVDFPQYVRCRRYFMKEGYIAQNPVTGGIDKVKTNPFGVEDKIDRGVAATDPQLSFVAFKGTDNKWISVLANYSLHYVGDWDNGTITADYFGEFSRQLQNKLNAGNDFVGIMSNGTSADVNIWDFSKDKTTSGKNFEKTEHIGNELAAGVYQKISKLEWVTSPDLSMQCNEVLIGTRKPSLKEIQKAKALVETSDYGNIKVNDDGLRRIYAREQVLLNDFPEYLLFPLRALRIGDILIGAMGGEIFAETGLWLKANSPKKNYFTIGLANGNLGYVPPSHEMKRGGYETWRSRISVLEENAEEIIKNKQMELLHLAFK